ncbi:hypothetical protein JOQ06_016255, partial [Pogonophryne albipinna]
SVHCHFCFSVSTFSPSLLLRHDHHPCSPPSLSASLRCDLMITVTNGTFVYKLPLPFLSESHDDPTVTLSRALIGDSLTGKHNSSKSALLWEARQPASYGAEFRRFSVDRIKPGKFEEFYKLILHIHRIANMEVMIGYDDIHGDLLPINNDDNFCKAVSTAHPLLRIFIQRQEEIDYASYGSNTLTRRKKPVVALRNNDINRKRPHIRIGMPQDFRPVSSIIDVDILPESHRRVRLYRHGSDKPLGFYIRDGTSVRVTPHGLEKVPGIFISRLVPGGLAESTGLLAVNDEVLEVNGIEVTGKSLDQVTDMMIANSHNLIVTVKPVNQRNNVVRSSRISGSSGQSSDSSGSTGYPTMAVVLKEYQPKRIEI